MKKNKLGTSIFHFAVWFPVLIITVLLISCRSDTTTNPSGGNPQTNDSLMFEKDSLVLRSTGIDSLHFYCLGIPSVDSCRIEFTGLTNIDSTKGIFSVTGMVTNDSILHPPYINVYAFFWSLGITDFNRFHNYYFPGHYFNPIYTLIYLAISNSYSTESKYIILKNIRIYKVKSQ